MDQQPQPPQQPQSAPPQPAPQPSAPGQPVLQQPVYMENPGQTLGIIGLILNFLGVGIGGIVLGVMSRNKSKQVGMSTVLGTISLVWGIILTVLVVLWIIAMIFLFLLAATSESSSSSTSSDSSSLFNTN